jgi:hypothetical protein
MKRIVEDGLEQLVSSFFDSDKVVLKLVTQPHQLTYLRDDALLFREWCTHIRLLPAEIMLGYPGADTTITIQLSGIALFWGELDKFSLFSVPSIRVDHNDLGPFRGSPMNISNLRNPDP